MAFDYLHFADINVSVPLDQVQRAAAAAGYRLVQQEHIQKVQQISTVTNEVLDFARDGLRKRDAFAIGDAMLAAGAIEFEELPHPNNLYRLERATVLRSTAHYLMPLQKGTR